MKWVTGMLQWQLQSFFIRIYITLNHSRLTLHWFIRSLGMEHDGPIDANECEPDRHLMSASLGAGKCSFSRCSSRYLRKFLRSSQATCLYERQSTRSNRTVELANQAMPDLLSTWSDRNKLPGQLYDLHRQCSLRFGRLAVPLSSESSRHASNVQMQFHSHLQCAYNLITAMKEHEICAMIKCQVQLGDRLHVYNAHPALDGSRCGRNKVTFLSFSLHAHDLTYSWLAIQFPPSFKFEHSPKS